MEQLALSVALGIFERRFKDHSEVSVDGWFSLGHLNQAGCMNPKRINCVKSLRIIFPGSAFREEHSDCVLMVFP